VLLGQLREAARVCFLRFGQQASSLLGAGERDVAGPAHRHAVKLRGIRLVIALHLFGGDRLRRDLVFDLRADQRLRGAVFDGVTNGRVLLVAAARGLRRQQLRAHQVVD
jgi:hypothetical protein